MENLSASAVTIVGLIVTVFVAVYVGSMGGFISGTSQTNVQSTSTSNDINREKATDKKDDKSNKFPRGKLSVYFGSQTGTAEGFARIVVEEGKKKGYDAKMVDLEDFDDLVLQTTELAIFLMATYGEGEPTDNATKFYKWIRGDVADGFLQQLKYCVFGLGNRQYEHFNRMGVLTDELLSKFGATRALEVGLGDDDGSLEDDFDKWRSSCWEKLMSLSSYQSNSSLLEETLEREIDLVFDVVVLSARHDSSKPKLVHSLSKHFFSSVEGNVNLIRELRNTSGGARVGSTLHMEIDVTSNSRNGGAYYQTADNLAILPINSSDSVAELATSQGYSLDDIINLIPIQGKEAEFKSLFPTPCTIREALTKYIDIKGHVRPSLTAQLLSFVQDEKQKAWLIDLLQKGNRASFKKTIEDNLRSLHCLLCNELSSCKLPLAVFFHIAPVIQPRYYTISSSSSMFPKAAHITVSIAEQNVMGPFGNESNFVGLCSNQLNICRRELEKKEKISVQFFIKDSSFRLPASLSTPIILIGPGTGIAPMRALLQERQYLRDKSPNEEYGRTTLYFGSRRHDEDFIYKDEIDNFKETKVLTDLHLAFSREQKEKVYVQHLMLRENNMKDIWIDLSKGAYIYVCGATQMGADVTLAFISIMMKNGLNKEAAEKQLNDWRSQGRYIQELWN